MNSYQEKCLVLFRTISYGRGTRVVVIGLKGYLAHKLTPTPHDPRRTLGMFLLVGPMV